MFKGHEPGAENLYPTFSMRLPYILSLSKLERLDRGLLQSCKRAFVKRLAVFRQLYRYTRASVHRDSADAGSETEN